METLSYGIIAGRKLEFFTHRSGAEFGYPEEGQLDTFAVLHPLNEEEGKEYPLDVVFHSAGHDVFSCVSTIYYEGNHDIYHTPADMFGLFPDCRNNMNDFWWGGVGAHGEFAEQGRGGTELQPAEKRFFAELDFVFENYAIDRERVYAVGNSMGGSGALGIAMPRGDIFAAIKANVPAGVRHAADRCCFDTEAPEGFSIPDPPVVVDYSAQNDDWSDGHEILYRAAKEKKYQIFGYFGMFGHENNDWMLKQHNDLIHSFDIWSVKLHEAYPVFTDADTDDTLPWPKDRKITTAGQINSFFRWKNLRDEAGRFEISLRLLRQDEWETRVTLPKTAEADLTFRRLQNFRLTPGERIKCTYRGETRTVTVAPDGLPMIGRVTVTDEPETLVLERI